LLLVAAPYPQLRGRAVLLVPVAVLPVLLAPVLLMAARPQREHSLQVVQPSSAETLEQAEFERVRPKPVVRCRYCYRL
jgi:hypothetical protein